MTAAASPAATLDGRRTDLDWIRIGAFGLLILYHVGMFYTPDSWDWHAKSRWSSEPLTLAMYLTNPWRLGLLFLVSGAATRFMVRNTPPGALARSRTARLLPPLLLGVFVVVPPQTYVQVVSYAGFEGNWAEFYGRYLLGPGWRIGGEPLITPTYNHLWFVAYLWVYTLALAALLARVPDLALRLERFTERALTGLGGWGLLLWPVTVLALARLALAPVFGSTHALVDDWYNHAQYLFLFGLGFAIASSAPVWAALDRRRWLLTGLALAAYALWAAYAWRYRVHDHEPAAWLRLTMGGVYALDQWAWMAAILAWGRRLLSGRDGPVRRYLTEAVFPFYIAHQTVIVLAGFHLTRLGWPAPTEATAVIALTVLACFATYELVRRVQVLRPLFGLKPALRTTPDQVDAQNSARSPKSTGARNRRMVVRHAYEESSS
jgi:glucans biosynthesis protein C